LEQKNARRNEEIEEDESGAMFAFNHEKAVNGDIKETIS
jgi:hypothetical protein